MDPNCPVPFSTRRFSLPPKPNSTAVISLSGSNPAHAKVTVSGLAPDPGLTDNPLHRGGLLVGVGVMVGVGAAVGVTVGDGVADGVVVGVVERSALLLISVFSLATAHSRMGRTIMTIITI